MKLETTLVTQAKGEFYKGLAFDTYEDILTSKINCQ